MAKKAKPGRQKWGPRMVPTARKGLVRELRDEVANYSVSLELFERKLLSEKPDGIPREYLEDPHRLARVHRSTERLFDSAREATLYWVTAPMTRMAAGASVSLPSWSPGQAAPSSSGIALFEEPIGDVSAAFGDPVASLDVRMDGLLWGIRDDVLEIVALSRFLGHKFARPKTIPVDELPVCRTHHFTRNLSLDDESLSTWEKWAVANVLGSLWLLMGQDKVASMSDVSKGSSSTPSATAPVDRGVIVADPARVSVVDLHPGHAAPRDVGGSDREVDEGSPEGEPRAYRHRWWVEGHWRQQACGPNQSERRPMWIAPHVKGPVDRPFITERERVYVVRD